MIVKCSCQHCSEYIEFESDDLAEDNCIVPCPHCGLETKLFVPPATDNFNSEPSEETGVPAKQSDSIPKAEADKALKETQWKEIEEIANSRLIYSNLDSLEFRGDTVTITKRGLANALASGMIAREPFRFHQSRQFK